MKYAFQLIHEWEVFVTIPTRQLFILFAACAWLAGCGGSGTPSGDADTSEAGDAGDVDGGDVPPETPGDPPDDTIVDAPVDAEEDAAEDATEDSEEDASEDPVEDVEEEEVVPGVCGDGTRDRGEACDDGNTVTEDCDTTLSGACLADCSLLMATCPDSSTDPGEACDDGDRDSMDDCTTSCTRNDRSIGAPCTCTGSGCSPTDPTMGTITGCDSMRPHVTSTRSFACLRSFSDSGSGIDMHFPEGYCTLLAISCATSVTGACDDIPVTGDTSAFTCPTGYAVRTETRTFLGVTLTIMYCLVECTSDSDCRWNAIEETGSPWAGACGDYRCGAHGDAGEMVCTDARNHTP
jgi:hypothetical protein